ncbi:NUDIX hydrolase [Gryllotalpicola protaetiae]|uniref:NUDIX domain-containing protein n=1 Tax=Gryllotalpicola protaetiae TaxID=2419771 RepID=A0A387BLM8_9MICO|nr:NUDIX domain-containing protein [Gryllotalpicola protaetiae]AYG03272.1 NUDIX domain-containing protein [Gryllotalpicola protaetiae]
MLHDDVLAHVSALPAGSIRDAYLKFISSAGERAVRRDGGPEHITASCFVFSPDLRRTLLCFHGKGRFWVQFGGHLEAHDTTLASAAVREAREESGISDLALVSDAIVDLDRHELGGGFACTAHWDVGFVALADLDAAVIVSDESEDVRWFDVDALPADAAAGLAQRIEHALRAVVRAHLAQSDEAVYAPPDERTER